MLWKFGSACRVRDAYKTRINEYTTSPRDREKRVVCRDRTTAIIQIRPRHRRCGVAAVASIYVCVCVPCAGGEFAMKMKLPVAYVRPAECAFAFRLLRKWPTAVACLHADLVAGRPAGSADQLCAGNHTIARWVTAAGAPPPMPDWLQSYNAPLFQTDASAVARKRHRTIIVFAARQYATRRRVI